MRYKFLKYILLIIAAGIMLFLMVNFFAPYVPNPLLFLERHIDISVPANPSFLLSTPYIIVSSLIISIIFGKMLSKCYPPLLSAFLISLLWIYMNIMNKLEGFLRIMFYLEDNPAYLIYILFGNFGMFLISILFLIIFLRLFSAKDVAKNSMAILKQKD